jgi:hypothetical protein
LGGWTQGWRPCSVKKLLLRNSKEVKTGWSNSTQIWQNLLRKAMCKKGLFYRWWYDDDEKIYTFYNAAWGWVLDVQWNLELRTQSVPVDGSTFELNFPIWNNVNWINPL